jgi:isopentenyl diphosphate isomerase/L-lactate dehydrogenase-like FMN-dependent dehydrogenase
VRVQDAVTVADVERMARRRLPKVIYDVLAGGAGDEVSLRANRSALEHITFRPRVLGHAALPELSTTVLGDEVSMPVLLAPTGAGRVVSSDAELAVARAARRAGTIYMQSSVTSFPLEDVARAGSGPLWFQLYLPRERRELQPLLARIAAAGYTSLAITVDTPVFGNRDRDARSGILGSRIAPRFLLQGVLHPRWAVEFGRANLMARPSGGARRMSRAETAATILASACPVGPQDVQAVRDLWHGSLLIKGVMRADECAGLVDLGVNGIVVSNHGGRQLDGVPATIDVLASVVDAVDGRAEVFIDGGFRRGTDVVKALALGARAVFVGRPYLYGLAAAGQTGVEVVLEMFRAEVARTMALVGAARVCDIERSLVSTKVSGAGD